MTEHEITGLIIDICIEIHSNLRPGLLESVYEEILCYELLERNIHFERQKGIPVYWKNLKMDLGFRCDVIAERKAIVELKSVETIAPVHAKILLTYLKLTKIKVGLLLNFNVPLMKDGITRIVHNL